MNVGSFEPTFFLCVSVRMAITAQAECRDGVFAHRHDRGEREGLRRSPQGSDDCRSVLGNDRWRPQGCSLVANCHPERRRVAPKSIYETWLLVALVELGSKEQDLKHFALLQKCNKAFFYGTILNYFVADSILDSRNLSTSSSESREYLTIFSTGSPSASMVTAVSTWALVLPFSSLSWRSNS